MRVLYTMSWSYSPFPKTSWIHTLLTQLCILCLIVLKDQFALQEYSCMGGLPLETGRYIHVCIINVFYWKYIGLPLISLNILNMAVYMLDKRGASHSIKLDASSFPIQHWRPVSSGTATSIQYSLESNETKVQRPQKVITPATDTNTQEEGRQAGDISFSLDLFIAGISLISDSANILGNTTRNYLFGGKILLTIKMSHCTALSRVQKVKLLTPSVIIWVPEPTWRKERTNSQRSSSDLYIHK